MGRLRILSGDDVCAILKTQGFRPVRRKGSHIVMQRNTGDSTITVPVPNHKELALGTLASIIRQAQVAKFLFESE